MPKACRSHAKLLAHPQATESAQRSAQNAVAYLDANGGS
jgi:hypothetical protein